MLEDGAAVQNQAVQWSADADLVVFSWYGDRFMRRLMRERFKSGKRWCFWGERPAFRNLEVSQPPRLSRLFEHADEVSKSDLENGTWAIDEWKREFGNERRYFNMPYFSDLRRFARSEAKPSPGGDRMILFSGALIHRKGIDLLARAVARQRRNLRLDILGAGNLEAQIRATLAPCADRVRFLGFKQWSELPDAYHAADVLCAPSLYDGWRMIIPEGLAAGLPVIATDRMGVSIDLLKDAGNGWTIRAGNQADLQSALIRVADLPDNRLAEMATATAQTHSLHDGVGRFCEGVHAALFPVGA